jgi:YfiH family protein
MQNNGFVRVESEGLTYYSCIAIENLPKVRHGFSSRGISPEPATGDLNLGHVPWDPRPHVEENRRRFLTALGIRPDHLATVAQIHSAEFHIIKTRADQWNPHTRGDALATAEPGVALAVQVADCFPVLISDPRAGVIAAVHAGWRGSLARILERTLKGLQSHLNTHPADTLVAIGPGIRSCCYEVGLEVASAFELGFPGVHLCTPRPEEEGRFLLDLPRALSIQVLEAGVPLENLFDLGLCTHCNPHEFFSHRGEGPRAGRMMGVICRCE